jgi:hypothetical protein
MVYINNQLERGKSKLDPKEFRGLYINKIYSYQDFSPKTTRIPSSAFIGSAHFSPKADVFCNSMVKTVHPFDTVGNT